MRSTACSRFSRCRAPCCSVNPQQLLYLAGFVFLTPAEPLNTPSICCNYSVLLPVKSPCCPRWCSTTDEFPRRIHSDCLRLIAALYSRQLISPRRAPVNDFIVLLCMLPWFNYAPTLSLGPSALIGQYLPRSAVALSGNPKFHLPPSLAGIYGVGSFSLNRISSFSTFSGSYTLASVFQCQPSPVTSSNHRRGRLCLVESSLSMLLHIGGATIYFFSLRRKGN
ncbi:hypothetical protein DEU56DRAFT_419165 [Suillus clintonianus]|uniref:uncharacterized protein n=1 Tax=Suillus clintonianus TaxID=1904413 RepID=UPI001B872EDF|nr:uncharacterized protein DEU56DRAFT_419165 [Suillus clintonianus]KAG2133314.1 hypothetical protein DEU56DRAFT_419165 [Suillus clintonianus]